MNEMIERVALAITNDLLQFDPLAPHEDFITNVDWNRVARAVIAAMREPTKEMLMSAGLAHKKGTFRDAYQATIDEALK